MKKNTAIHEIHLVPSTDQTIKHSLDMNCACGATEMLGESKLELRMFMHNIMQEGTDDYTVKFALNGIEIDAETFSTGVGTNTASKVAEAILEALPQIDLEIK